jgi:hypothetical protein
MRGQIRPGDGGKQEIHLSAKQDDSSPARQRSALEDLITVRLQNFHQKVRVTSLGITAPKSPTWRAARGLEDFVLICLHFDQVAKTAQQVAAHQFLPGGIKSNVSERETN